MLRRAFVVFTIAATLAAPALAQETMRVRGAIERIDGSTLYVKTRDGADLKIALADQPVFTAIIPATLADLKPGTYVGSAAMPGPDGSLSAVEVHIFPEAMRGTGEGHRPFFIPGSTMTNGTAAGATVMGTDGSAIKVKYKDGEKLIIVPPNVPIDRYEIGSAADLKTGAAFAVIAATKKPDGSLEAARINVGRDGVVP